MEIPNISTSDRFYGKDFPSGCLDIASCVLSAEKQAEKPTESAMDWGLLCLCVNPCVKIDPKSAKIGKSVEIRIQ